MGFLLELLGGRVLTVTGLAGGDRRRRRRDTVAWAEGRDVIFDGWVLGDQPYCRPPGGALGARPGSLRWGPFPTGSWATHAVPLPRLRLLQVRPGSRADGVRIPVDWLVAQCADGPSRVLLACQRLDMRCVESSLGGPLPEEQHLK